MTGWLAQTLLASTGVIALVLAVRRPAARWFGPEIAYLLWALPLLRLLLPPIVLPAWLAPAATVPTVPTPVIAARIPIAVDHAAAMPLAAPIAAGPDWDLIALAVWAAGAMAFLCWRIVGYRAMRWRLLARALPVGNAGRVRLVETTAVTCPVAFGVRDQVVAMPRGFMARVDRHGRDLAIAHELAHHARHDLAANILAQLVLAVHWWNPVAWAGWRAMRRDQEAACDARVLAGRDRATRAAYGRLVASFAAGGRLALAAPMAGQHFLPSLGERSIIHRLRSLTIAEPSVLRRRLGLGVLALGGLALPATASISYAAPPAAPVAPEAPTAAHGPDHPLARHLAVPDARPGGEGAATHVRTVIHNGATMTIASGQPLGDDEAEARLAAPPAPPVPPVPPVPPAPPAPPAQADLAVVDEADPQVHPRVVTIDTDRIEREARSAAAAGLASARAAIQRARVSIAGNPALSGEVRADVLRELDREIAEMDQRK